MLPGTSGADNDSAFVGHDWDVLRWADPNNSPNTPLPDSAASQTGRTSAARNASGAYFVFCDGSVHLIPHDIDPTVFTYMANRQDGVPDEHAALLDLRRQAQ